MKRFVLLIAIIVFSSSLFAQENKANNFYFVFLRTNPDKEQLSDDKVEALQAAHMANIDSLYKIGKLVAAGPFDGGGGLFVMKAPSLEQATSDFNSDPAVKANRFLTDIHPITFYKGQIATIPDEYEMVKYKFVEFTPKTNLNKCCLHEFEFLLKDFAEKETTIASYRFEDTCGGILIINTEDDKLLSKKLDAFEFIVKEKIEYSIKTLWIAKETFEKY